MEMSVAKGCGKYKKQKKEFKKKKNEGSRKKDTMEIHNWETGKNGKDKNADTRLPFLMNRDMEKGRN